MKTNKHWYFYTDQAACFRLINGELWMAEEPENNQPDGRTVYPLQPDEKTAYPLSQEEWYEDEPMTRDQMIQDLEVRE